MKCNYCEFPFSNFHEGEKQTRKKPFKCVICDTRFESKKHILMEFMKKRNHLSVNIV